MIVGKVNPLSQDARDNGGKPDQWSSYNWEAIRNGSIARHENCLQSLSTATDANGEFRFDRVDRSAVWLELVHEGGGVAPVRLPDLRKLFPAIENLALVGKLSSSVKLFVDRKKWPKAHSVQLDAPFFMQYPDCVQRPFSKQTLAIDTKEDLVEFKGLAAGFYRVTVHAKPVSLGNGAFKTVALGNYVMEVPEGEELVGDL